MADKIRLILIAVLLFLSVVVDSVYYAVSAITDGVFVVGVVILAIPIVRKAFK